MTLNTGLAHELVIERVLQKKNLVVVTDALRVILHHLKLLLLRFKVIR